MKLSTFLIIAGASGLLAWLFGMLWRRYYGAGPASLIEDEALDTITAQLRSFGFGSLKRRPLFQARSLWAMLERESYRVELELCDGGGRDYTRMVCEFATPLNQGVRLLRQSERGLSSLGLGDTLLGDTELDERFLIAGRDRDRLESMMRGPLRRHLLTVRDRVDDFQLTDQALYLNVEHVPEGAALATLLDDTIVLIDALVRWALKYGPIATLQTGQYQDALAEMEMYTSRFEAVVGPSTEDAGSEPVDMRDASAIARAAQQADEIAPGSDAPNPESEEGAEEIAAVADAVGATEEARADAPPEHDIEARDEARDEEEEDDGAGLSRE